MKGGGDPYEGVLLAQGPAGALATFLDEAPRATGAQRACAKDRPDVLLRFAYPGKPSLDAALVEFGCTPRGPGAPVNGVVFFGDQARSLDPDLAGVLVASAGSYDIARRPPTPGLFGYTVTGATKKARRSGFTVGFGGEGLDQSFAPGTVLLQFPPAGMGDIGNDISLILSVPPSPPCEARDLALVYDGFQGATGSWVGSITIWDVSRHYCSLQGPLKLAGTDRHGKRVTRVVVYNPLPLAVLSPGSRPRGAGPPPPVGEVIAEISFSTPTPANCNIGAGAGATEPAAWALVLPKGTVSVANSGGEPRRAFTVDCGALGPLGPVAVT